MGKHDPVFGIFALRRFDDFFKEFDLFFEKLFRVGPEQMVARFPDGVGAFAGVQYDVENFTVAESVIGSAEVLRIDFSVFAPVFVVASDQSHRFEALVFGQHIEKVIKIVCFKIVEVF